MVLLDGGYHHGKMNADYFANLYKDAKEGECPPRSLEEEITHYENDFDEYILIVKKHSSNQKTGLQQMVTINRTCGL